jgi:hypothetical protein
MITNFNEQLWIDFDLEIAVFLENLVSWVRFNATKDKPEQRNFHDGRYWSYNSYPEFAKLFSGWSSKTMRTIIARCVKHELILVGNFNKKKYDNTNWYTLSDKALAYFPIAASKLMPDSSVDSNIPVQQSDTPAQSGSTPDQTGRPIPLKPNSLRDITNSNSKILELMRGMIDVYKELFPNNPQPHQKLISTSLEKVLRGLIKRWPEADPNGNALDIPAFRRYLEYLRSAAPKFSLGEYETSNGNFKKNGLETFARWNTLVKTLEGAYS